MKIIFYIGYFQNNKVDLDEAMEHCSRYISILGEVEHTYADVYESMVDVYHNVKAAKVKIERYTDPFRFKLETKFKLFNIN